MRWVGCVHGTFAAPAVSWARNLLDPEFEQIHASAAPPSANLSGPRGIWTAAPVFGPQRQTLAARPITRQGLRPNPPWIMPAGLVAHVTSTSPGGSTAPSLTDVPAEVLLEDPVDNMDMRAHVKDPTKYLSIITQYCRTREYHGRQLHLSPAENRSAYLTYRYHVKQARDISSSHKTVSAYSDDSFLWRPGSAHVWYVTRPR